MTRTKLSILVLITGALVLLGAIGAALSYGWWETATIETSTLEASTQRETASSTTTHVATSKPASSSRPVPFTASLARVIHSAGEYGCHYATEESGSQITGTVFVSDGRARGTFVASLPGSTDTILWYFLMTPTQHAVWFVFPEDAPAEFRGKAYLHVETDPEKMKEGREDLLRDLPDLYGCVPWEFEATFFTLPADIQYVSEAEIQAYDAL